MVEQSAFERILESLYDAMLDGSGWPATSALIDEACGLKGNALAVGEGPLEDIRLSFVGMCYRGRRRIDWEREYVEAYFPTDERIPRLLQRPFGRLLHMKTDQYTAKELKHSRAYNEFMIPTQFGNSMCVTLEGLDGSYVSWAVCDPVASGGWSSPQIAMVKALAPHIRQFGVVRQALVRAQAQSTTVTALLDNPRVGVVHLDWRGRILAANDRACAVLRDNDGIAVRDGVLRAEAPEDRRCLDRLVAAALPASSAAPVSGSMPLRRSSMSPPLVVHVKPVATPQPDYGAEHVAALLLIVEPGRERRIDPNLVAGVLGLTPTEGRVAAWLAEGRTVREMAEATGHTKGAIYWHLKQIYQKLSISGQVDLTRMVLSVTALG